MTPIKRKPTITTPAVLLDPNQGVLKIYGRSSPENALQFYEPIRSILSKGTASDTWDIRMKMEYFNTSSSKCLYDLFKELKHLTTLGKRVVIRWYFDEDDEDMREAGEDYSSLLDLPFKYVEYRPKDIRKAA